MNAPPPHAPPPQQPPPGYGPPPQGYGAPPPGYVQPPHPPGPPAKKGANGCLLAVGIVLGLLVLSGLVAGVVAYRFATSPDGKKMVSAVTSSAALAQEAMNAPGAAELRAVGCATALIMDTAKVEAIAEAFVDAGEITVNGERLAIVCNATGGKTPTCDQVAGTYVGAVGGTARGVFSVSVATSGGSSECEEEYSADGKRLLVPPPSEPKPGKRAPARR